ncbi:GSK3B-interacting protein isoform X1 [Coturnix japonica]|uniref:GSK3B-interacting protein isoform X1 n=1 Tax=Coturnix japonica TaxID=93934 RepID=UPI0013A5D335|nr:GSK3B-interacting protein isoform X1 [Coturnix japonica]
MDSENGHGMVAAGREPRSGLGSGLGSGRGWGRGGRSEMERAEAAGPSLAPQRGLPAAGIPQRPSLGRWGGTACPQAPTGSSILTRPPPPPSSRRPASAEGTAAPHGTRGGGGGKGPGSGRGRSPRRLPPLARPGESDANRSAPSTPTTPNPVTGTVTHSGSGVSERRRRRRKRLREAPSGGWWRRRPHRRGVSVEPAGRPRFGGTAGGATVWSWALGLVYTPT